MRILAQSEDDDAHPKKPPSPSLLKQPRSLSLLHGILPGKRSAVLPAAPGIERTVLSRMGDVPVESQMRTFYNAYSSVCCAFLLRCTATPR